MKRMRLAAPVAYGVSLLCICVLVLGMFPAAPAEATRRPVQLNDLLDDFAEGTFLRTALVQEGDIEAEELDGSVQLAQTGSMGPFRGTGFQLPYELTQMGVAAVENRLYVVAGNRTIGGSDELEEVGEVWSAEVLLEPEEGRPPSGDTLAPCTPDEDCLPAPSNWRREPSLPLAAGANPLPLNPDLMDDPISRTHSVAVTAVDTSGDNDYIYVLGGAGGSTEQSQFSVRIGVIDNAVDPDTGEKTGRGVITEWITSDDVVVQDGTVETYPLRIPGTDPDRALTFDQHGVYLASATTLEINGTTYLYLVGGRVRWENLEPKIVVGGSPFVYYARVGDDGLLYRPDTTTDTPGNVGWAQQTLPESIWKINDVGVGIWNTAAVTGDYADFGRALYIMGGQVEADSPTNPDIRNQYSARVARLLINDDGSLQTDTADVWIGNMTDEFYSHGAVEFRSNLYVTGGRKGEAEPTTDGLTSYIEYVEGLSSAPLVLHDFEEDIPDDVKRHFEPPDQEDPDGPPLREAVSFHGMTALEDGYGSGFLYVMGGSLESGKGISDEVYVLRIGDSFYKPQWSRSGWYYSPRFPIDLNEDGQNDSVFLESVEWNTDLDVRQNDNASIDVQLWYRTSPDACENTTWTTDDWTRLDGDPDKDYYSKKGFNEVEIFDADTLEDAQVDPPERTACFQYRAELMTDAIDAETNTSPRLTNLTIRAYTEDSPDMQVDAIEPVWEDTPGGARTLADLNISIKNRYDEEPNRTLRADIEVLADDVADDEYFDIFLLLFEPGTSVVSPTLPFDFDSYETYSDTIRLSVGNPRMTYQFGARKDLWPADTVRQISPTLADCNDPDSSECLVWVRTNEEFEVEAVDPKFLFTEAGLYHVCVAVDAYVDNRADENFMHGDINETLDGAEENNFTCTEIDIEEPPTPKLRVYLPFIGN